MDNHKCLKLFFKGHISMTGRTGVQERSSGAPHGTSSLPKPGKKDGITDLPRPFVHASGGLLSSPDF